MKYYGQSQQDEFVLSVLKHKKNGYFVEIGSNHPQNINNTFLLETQYNWKGIMVEYNPQFLPLYREYRPNSLHIINDATRVDYKSAFQSMNMPHNIDYLQIDLEANNGSTINTLKKLDAEIMDTYKFATITFEHDIYHTNFGNTRLVSRDIFKKRGYVCVFEDVHNSGCPYEDWYVHPDLVDMEYISQLVKNNSMYYVHHPITNKTIDWSHIQYDFE